MQLCYLHRYFGLLECSRWDVTSINGVNILYRIIMNPSSKSGRGVKIWEKSVEPELIRNRVSYKTYMTKGDNQNGPIVEKVIADAKADEDDIIRLIILGGDGTVNEIIQSLPLDIKVHISVIPTGSSNDLARDVGISTDPAKAIAHLIDSPVKKEIDLGVVHYENNLVRNGAMQIPDRRFIVSTGIGYDAAICEEAMNSRLKNILNKLGLGKLTYLGVALKQLATTRYITGELILDGNENSIIPLDRLLFVTGMNHKYEGGGFMFGPDADDADGLLDLCVVSRIKKSEILRVLPTAYKGEHFAYDGVDSYRTSRYSIRTSEPLWVHTDGEVRTKADYISVSLVSKAITLVY